MSTIVLGALLLSGSLTLLGLVGASAGVLPGLPGRGRRDLHSPPRHATVARGLGELRQLIRGLVYRLEVALVLGLATGRRDVRVPPLGHPTAREMDLTLIERSFELQQQHRLFDIEDPRHDPIRLDRNGGLQQKGLN